MNTTILIAAFAIGATLGTFFFVVLWHTVQRSLSSDNPALVFFASFLLRISVVLAGFYLVAGGRWERLAACMIGFLAARFVLVSFYRNGRELAAPQGHSMLHPKRRTDEY